MENLTKAKLIILVFVSSFTITSITAGHTMGIFVALFVSACLAGIPEKHLNKK